MELLAQCSHALYNEELLFAKKRERELEKELNNLKKQYCVPRVKYKNEGKWLRSQREPSKVTILELPRSDKHKQSIYNLYIYTYIYIIY